MKAGFVGEGWEGLLSGQIPLTMAQSEVTKNSGVQTIVSRWSSTQQQKESSGLEVRCVAKQLEGRPMQSGLDGASLSKLVARAMPGEGCKSQWAAHP